MDSPPHFIDIALVRDLARAQGFSSVGFAALSEEVLAPHGEGLQQWLAAGFHGEMSFLDRHAEQRARPDMLLPGARSVVMVTLDYRPDDPQWLDQAWAALEEPWRANVSLYARGRDYHKLVRARLQRLAESLSKVQGEFAYRAFCDSAPVMEIPLALEAGLGWRGKHTLLLNRDRGSMFFIGSLYTSLALKEFAEPQEDHCGTCTRCIEVCPTNAIVAPHRVDARRCISYLTIEHPGAIPLELREAIGNRIYGCDDCQLACPWNKFAQAPLDVAVLQDFAPRHGLEKSSLLELWSWTEQEFLRNTEGSPIRRIGYWRWRRNLVVAMGNALRKGIEPKASDIRKSLESLANELSCGSDDTLLEHVRWALSA